VSTKRAVSDLKKAREKIIKTAKEIEKSDFIPNPGIYCDFCDFKMLCPAWT
jgi:hypothetical protein